MHRLAIIALSLCALSTSLGIPGAGAHQQFGAIRYAGRSCFCGRAHTAAKHGAANDDGF